MRIALFTTCVGDTLFPGVGIATVELLERLVARGAHSAIIRAVGLHGDERRLPTGLAVKHRDRRALGSELASGGKADTGCAARDERA